MKELTIPNSVTSIGESAFEDCTGLTEVTIPNSVTSIGSSAFSGCTRLTSIVIEEGNRIYDSRENCNAIIETASNTLITGCKNTVIPNSVTSIGKYAFYGCSGLTEVTIPNSVTEIGSSAFSGCTGLTEITIPNSVTSIGEDAFFKCTGLTTLNFNAENCTTMGSSNYPVFSGCSNLIAVNIGESVKNIPAHAFYGCTGLTEVTISNSVTSIGEYAFSGCTGLTEVIIPNSVTSIGEYAFSGCTGLTEVIIPNSVTSIGKSAFRDCTGLTEVTISNSVTSIGEYAFSGCTGLTEVTIPNSVTSIGSCAFLNCTGLTEVTIGNSVTSIGYSAFNGCTGLTEITIPNSVTSIGSGAFYGCSGLTAIYCHTTTPPTIYDNTFSSYTASLYVPINSRYAYKSAPYWKKFTSINKYLVDGLYYNILSAIDAEVTYKDSNYSGTINVPETIEIEGVTYSVTSIGESAFSGCTGLTEVTIPNSVTSIGAQAFFNCKGLKSITIPNSVTSISSEAFFNCNGLKSITIPNSVTLIGSYAFSGCTGLTEVTIPNSVTSIGSCAFLNCTGLTEVTIGNSVTSIGYNAFLNCSGLTVIYCHATTPPTIYDNTFSSYTASLYVPIKSIDAYKKANYWKNFTIDKITNFFVDGLYYDILSITDVEVTHKDSNYNSYSGTINIPETIEVEGVTYHVTTVSASAFRNCTGLTEVTIPNSVTSIGDYAFYGCRKIREVTIPNSVISIGSSAFYNCEALRIVTIGNGVAEIGESAFDGCESIKTINSYAKVPPTIYSYTFNEYVNDNATLHVVNGCKDDYAGAKYWKYFLNITDDLISADFIVSESIVLDQTNITAAAGETVVLTATIYPEDATEKGVVWSVSDAAIATIEPLNNVSAKITVLREGVATITAETIDGSNLSATCTIDVYSDIEALLRDSENVEYYDLNGFRVENPTRGIYIVKCGDIVYKVFVNKTR